MSDQPKPYWPSQILLGEMGFYEGYGEMWLLDGDNDAVVMLDFDEYGTLGYVQKANGAPIDFMGPIEGLGDLEELIQSIKEPA